MEIEEVYSRIRSFIDTALSNYAVTVIIRDQIEAPIPTKPFITLAISQLTETSMKMFNAIDNLGLQRVVSNMSFLVTLESYADVAHEAESMLNKVERRLGTQTAYNIFKGDLAYMNTVMGVSAIPAAISGINESRAILEMEFNLTQSIDDNVGLIEHIYITDLNNGKEIIINK